MDQQEQYIFEDQALKVFSLFPRRDLTSISSSPTTFYKLFQNLECSICREIVSNPVYLKCSHRFCKDCIEKYIRSSSKRSCPNCRGDLSTKRDLRSDFNIESLINFAFGDVKKFSQDLWDLDKLQLDKIKPVDTLIDLRKVESSYDSRQRIKPDQEYVVSSATLKRSRTNDGEGGGRKRRKQNSQKKIESKSQVELSARKIAKISQATETPKEPVRQAMRQPMFPTNSRRRHKNPPPVIQILESQSEQIQVQQIPPEQFFNGPEDSKIGLCSISMIAEVSQVQSVKKISYKQEAIFSKEPSLMQEKDQACNNLPQLDQLPKDAILNEIQPNSMSIYSKETIEAYELLRQEFGQNNIMNSILQITNYNIYMLINLEKYPTCPFTPEINFKYVKTSAKCALNEIGIILAEYFNINRQSLKLFGNQNDGNDLIQLNPNHKMQEINQFFWKKQSGFEIIQFSQIISTIPNSPVLQYCKVKNIIENTRTLYYLIDFTLIN